MTFDPHGYAPTDDSRHEHSAQLAMRFVALLRTARSYQLGNQVLTTQVDHFLGVLGAAFADHGEIQLVDHDGDLHFNGARVPLRGANLKFLEQLQMEFAGREIAGLVFVPGLERPEFESFLRFFLASDAYKGMELFNACEAQGIIHVFPAFATFEADAVPAGEPALPELAQAFGAHQHALRLVEAFLGEGRQAAGVELRHLKRILQPLVDDAIGGTPDASLSTIDGVRPTAGAHALHVATLAVRIGAALGLDRRALSEIGAAALLHDTGKPAVAAGIPCRPEEWTAEQRVAAATHAIEGVRRVASANALNETSLLAMRIVLEHHAWGPHATPALPAGYTPSPFSEIVAIADAFVCLRFALDANGRQRTPCEALACVLGPLGEAFDPAVRAALVRSVGVYPPGQVVALDDGALAFVLATLPDAPEHPELEWLTGPGGEPLPADEARPAGRLPDDRRVMRALTRDEWPFGDATAA
ncbi:MAG: HD domain-containing protein [Candidatus Eisenbacteria bacterium]